MRFNTSKCEILQVGTGSRRLLLLQLQPNNFYTLNSDVLKLVSSVKYLGVLLTPNLSLWSEHIHLMAAKVNSSLSGLNRTFVDAHIN